MALEQADAGLLAARERLPHAPGRTCATSRPFPFANLPEDRVMQSVSHRTRGDLRAWLALAAEVPLTARVQSYPLADANRAVADVRDGGLDGAAVLVP